VTVLYPFTRAVVTGASSGIGEQIVELLAAAGVPTVAVARRGDRLEALAQRASGVEVLVADLGTAAGVAAVVARITDRERPVDLVVNNAGFGASGTFLELPVERQTSEIDVNVRALTELSHAALSMMVPAGRGWLLNVSSVASFQPAPNLAVYAATKAYVTSLTESLHEEAKASGVHVTALCPGLTRTEFQQVSNTDRYAGAYPSYAWTTTERVARTGLDDVVRNKALSVPGAQYKLLSALTNSAPRWLRRTASARVRRT
jgi:short-subunit dehydrogenase